LRVQSGEDIGAKNIAFNVTHEVAALQRITVEELRAKFADVGDDKTY
jgi:hypothetical protein